MKMISTYANKNSRLSVANVEQALNPSPERRVCLPAVPFLTPQKTGSWFRPTGHWQFTTENTHDCGSGIWFLEGGCGALFLYILWTYSTDSVKQTPRITPSNFIGRGEGRGGYNVKCKSFIGNFANPGWKKGEQKQTLDYPWTKNNTC